MPSWREVGPLHRTGQTVLDGSGAGQISFDVYSANHKWEIESVVVGIAGAQVGAYPQVVLYVGGQPSPGLSQGGTFLGGQETFQGFMTLTDADTLIVQFTTGTPGTRATAIIDGTNYLWR